MITCHLCGRKLNSLQAYVDHLLTADPEDSEWDHMGLAEETLNLFDRLQGQDLAQFHQMLSQSYDAWQHAHGWK